MKYFVLVVLDVAKDILAALLVDLQNAYRWIFKRKKKKSKVVDINRDLTEDFY